MESSESFPDTSDYSEGGSVGDDSGGIFSSQIHLPDGSSEYAPASDVDFSAQWNTSPAAIPALPAPAAQAYSQVSAPPPVQSVAPGSPGVYPGGSAASAPAVTQQRYRGRGGVRVQYAPGPATLPAPSSPFSAPTTPADLAVLAIWSGIGLAAGAAFLGAWGAGAGVVIPAAVRNATRTVTGFTSPDPRVRSEAIKSGTVAALGLGLSGVLIYNGVSARSAKAEK